MHDLELTDVETIQDSFHRVAAGGDQRAEARVLKFARRVVSRPSTKDYGSLSVFAQLRADVALEFNVPRGCFQPVPKVDSAVLLVMPAKERLPDDVLLRTEAVTRSAFTQRRKKLRNSVRPFLDETGEAGCPIDLERRADALSPREFVALAAFLLKG